MSDEPMLPLEAGTAPEPDIVVVPGRRLRARLVSTFETVEPGDFRTVATERLDLVHGGIAGDRHHGFTRLSGGREPWFPRGTEIANDRQLSLLSLEDLAEIATRLDVPEVRPEWIGANLVVEGIARFSFLPKGTRLFFENGAVVALAGQNAPCKFAGRAIAAEVPGRPDLELGFPKVAKRLRGVIGWVERPGPVFPGQSVSVHVPEQWIYPA